MAKPARTKAAPALRPLTPEEVAALVASWDGARTELSAAGDAVSAIQLRIEDLAADADRTDIDAELLTAQERVTKAHAAIAALTPLPDGTTLPKAKAKPAAPADAGLFTAGVDYDADGRMAVTVIGPAKGRRRAGFDFDAAPRTVWVTADEQALIAADASLSMSPGALVPGLEFVERRLASSDFDFAGRPTLSVTVLGPAKGRRRAGFDFGPQAQTVDVSAEQLTTILADDALAVSPA